MEEVMSEPHPAFANCGTKVGLEIWRIENFHPVPVDSSNYGKFFSGDSYIILKTSGTPGSQSHHIHFWLGASTTQDECGAAAILAVNLDDGRFHGGAIQHREIQGHESELFLGYFQPSILYLDGGHASGFSHVTTNAGAEKRLFQIKGKRNVRVAQIEPHVSRMNDGDCFILDKEHDIFVFVGKGAKGPERMKAISVAHQIRDQDHKGRGNIEIIDPYSCDADLNKFFATLGSGDKNAIPLESEGGDDEEFENDANKTVKLFEISDATGALKITEKTVQKRLLDTKECYILDAGNTGIYVWVGKKSSKQEKSEAMNRAQQYLTAQKRPAWVNVTKIPEGAEPTSFKVHFPNWA